MREPEAYKSIAKGTVEIDGSLFSIVFSEKKHCDNCYFYDNNLFCPSIATKICNTDAIGKPRSSGHILTKVNNEE